MPDQFIAHRHNRGSSDRIDELGMLYWKIGILVIALRVVIVVPVPPLLLSAFAQVVMLLVQIALIVVITDLLRLLSRTLRWTCQDHGGRATTTLQEVWHGWLCGDWLLRLAIDFVLAARIIPLAIMLAVQERLDWGGAAWLAIIGLSRVVIQERCTHASAGSDQQAQLHLR